jgi:hypothetical protein
MRVQISLSLVSCAAWTQKSRSCGSQDQATEGAAGRRADDEGPQAYLYRMSALLISKEGQPSLSDMSPPESLRSLERARTLTVLRRLDSGGG